MKTANPKSVGMKIKYYLRRPTLIYNLFKLILTNFFLRYFLILKGVAVLGKIHIKGKPHIDKREGKIVIKDNVTLNSSNFGYHAYIHPIKLFTDRKEAYIEIGENSRLHGTTIHSWDKIIIGKNVLIAGNAVIMDSNGHDSCWDEPEIRLTTTDKPDSIIIYDNVWIGLNSIILKGSSIGEGSIVAANSVVKGIFPPSSLIGGNPAKIIKRF